MLHKATPLKTKIAIATNVTVAILCFLVILYHLLLSNP